jgi:Lysine-specific metallo-endopeptidase
MIGPLSSNPLLRDATPPAENAMATLAPWRTGDPRDTQIAAGLTNKTSRSLTVGEKKQVKQALKNAVDMLDRTELSLTSNWDELVPGSDLTNRQVFEQYFGASAPALRANVLARVQRVRALIKTVDSASNVGSYVVRDTGPNKGGFAYVQPASGAKTVFLGDSFFKAPALGPDSQAGTFVHEFFHLVTYNGARGTDHVAGYKQAQYSPAVLRELANGSPSQAVNNNNLFEWYVEREK